MLENWEQHKAHYQPHIEHQLAQRLSGLDAPQRLIDAMRYAVLQGGKRLRPLLVYATGECFSIPTSTLDPIAVSLEFIHAYSLIHDDLPAMDNDDLRRGIPTCHKAFDEATAILAGDALQSLAFQQLAQATELTETQRLAAIVALSTAAGASGMVGGQTLDLMATGQTITLDALEHIHRRKTGALIAASVHMAALTSASIDQSAMTQLQIYTDAIGLAFQIQDDILDIESNTLTLGKQQGADAAQHKFTYPTLSSMEAAKKTVRDLQARANTALNNFGHRAAALRGLSEYIITRCY